MERLRRSFGEDRWGELGDVDGVGLLARFLRRLPEGDDGEAPPEHADDGGPLSREELGELRRHRRRRRREEAAQAPAPAAPPATPGAAGPVQLDVDSDSIPLQSLGDGSIFDSLSYASLIDEIPRLRDNFSEWLSSVDAEYIPNSSSLEELRRLRENVEYRLKALTVMQKMTQQELDDLIVTIRAREAMEKS